MSAGGEQIHVIVYADDIGLYSKTRFAMSTLLKKVENFFNARGMSINAAKCASLSMEASGRIRNIAVITDSVFSINDIPIWSIGISDYTKYLGS